MNEAEVRAAIALKSRRAARHEVLIVPELALAQSEARIDLAVIDTERLVGWEIKTRTDRLDRLPRQQESYSRVFDRVWLAADERHIAMAIELIPDWWGVARVDDRAGSCWLTTIRRPRINRAVDLRALVALLWREEVLDELARLGLAGGLERQPKPALWDVLAGAAPRRISRSQLRRRVRTRLMDRRDWRVG